MARLRLSAVIPVVFSGVAFALLVVLVVAGTRPGTAPDFYLLSLNTSKVGTNVIHFDTVDTTTGGTNDGGILGGLVNGLGGLVNNVTGQINTGLESFESTIITEATAAIGVKDVYNMYLSHICEGNLADEADPSSIRILACPTYDNATEGLAHISSSITSYVVVGTTNISVPALTALGEGAGSLQDILVTLPRAALVFLAVGTASSGLVVLLSLVSFVLPRVRLVSYANLIFSALAPAALLVGAVFVSVLGLLIARVVNGLGAALTVSAKQGTKATAIVWVAWAFSQISSGYWFLVWFVEVRRTRLVRKPRAKEEIGKYRATFFETRRSLKLDASEKI